MQLSPTVSTALYEKVLNTFPSRDFAFGALLEVVDICESSSVPTAAVECSSTPRLLINPEFVARHAHTSEKLLMLILHELNHVLLGHTRLFPLVTPIDNLVFDAMINAMLCKELPDPEYRALFTDFYSPNRFPECLLRPPDHVGFPKRPFRFPEALESEDMKDAKEVYEALYLPKGATYDDLRCVIRAHGCGSGWVLLGNHSEDRDSSLSSMGALRDSLQEVVGHWPARMSPTAGRTLRAVTEELFITPKRRMSNKSKLRGLLEKVGGLASSNGNFQRVTTELLDTISPIPARDRRATVLGALGSPCLLYNQEVPHEVPVPYGERVHVYLDVSGSVSGILDALYGAVLDCEQFVFPKVHLFSTVVKSVSIERLRKGECHTTGGNNMECVVEHMRRHKVRRAVMVTDGIVGTVAAEHVEILKKIQLGVALVGIYASRGHLESFGKFWTTVDLG